MAGSGLIGIKRRIKSVTNTRKITKAMGLVATSKLRKVKEALYVNNMYNDSLEKMFNEILNAYEGENIYKNGNGSSKKLYIIFTSDSGLCGSYNINVLNKFLEEFNKNREQAVVMLIGEKGVAFFKRMNYELSYKFVDVPDLPTLGDASEYASAALKLYKSGEVGEINAVYTRSITQTKNEVVVERIFPLQSSTPKKDDRPINMRFEPGAEDLINSIIPIYIREKMLNFLVNSKTSEQAVRMSAMDGATKNANQLLDKLKLQYNRMRQGAITQEISEIVGGAEAQK